MEANIRVVYRGSQVDVDATTVDSLSVRDRPRRPTARRERREVAGLILCVSWTVDHGV